MRCWTASSVALAAAASFCRSGGGFRAAAVAATAEAVRPAAAQPVAKAAGSIRASSCGNAMGWVSL